MIHQQLGDRYRVLEKLGEGGMGEVFLVQNIVLGRREALKVLKQQLGTSPELFARFRREARAIDRLDHPNIVDLYDAGELPGSRLYLTMEYVAGESAVRWLAREAPVPVETALRVLSQLADAVEHAHDRGVIHRDLKPGNLLLQHDHPRRSTLKVLDFGVAKIIDANYRDSILSQGSEILGTPAYMAPERAAGAGDEPRMDVYAFGCIAFEMIAGRPPFVGGLVKVLHDHAVTAAEPLARLRPGCPAEVADLVARCLQKEPAHRPWAAELAAALRSLTPAEPRSSSEAGLLTTIPLPLAGAEIKMRVLARLLARELIALGATDPLLLHAVDGVAAGESAIEQIHSALRDLELQREAAHTTQEIDAFADRAVALGAAQAEQHDELDRLYAALFDRLEQAPARVRDHPDVAVLFSRVAALRKRARAAGSR